MSDLVAYNADLISEIFGLQNNGALCYLNSLIQTLLSCSAFNDFMLNYKDEYIAEKNELAICYIDILSTFLGKQNKIVVTNIFAMLRTLSYKTGNKIIIGRQEDIYEGFLIMLDILKKNVKQLFHHRYKCEIICRYCGERRLAGPESEDYQEPPEIVIDLSETDPKIRNKLNTKQDIENYIKRNVQVPEDYTCEKCKKRNNKIDNEIEPNVLQVYTLMRLSEIIILLFKKYTEKCNIYFPPTLDFKSKSGNLHYKLVAQVEHIGNIHGGHYYTKCLRNKPANFHKRRRSRINKVMGNIDTKIEEMNKILKNELLLEKESQGVFLFNDDKIKYCPEGFVPTKETYMVFYHLISE